MQLRIGCLESCRKLLRFVDTRQVEFAGRMFNRLTGGSDEEVEVNGAGDLIGAQAGWGWLTQARRRALALDPIRQRLDMLSSAPEKEDTEQFP